MFLGPLRGTETRKNVSVHNEEEVGQGIPNKVALQQFSVIPAAAGGFIHAHTHNCPSSP